MRTIIPLFCLMLTALSCTPVSTGDVDNRRDVEVDADASLPDVDIREDVEVSADARPRPDVVADVSSAGVPVPTDLGPVQCRVTEDCGDAQLECNRAAPGGICIGCGETCPAGTECGFGACIRECEIEDDCHVGFRCLGSGRCALDTCDSDDDCEGPYVCGGAGTCERPLCDEGDCPAPLTCLQGRCVED